MQARRAEDPKSPCVPPVKREGGGAKPRLKHVERRGRREGGTDERRGSERRGGEGRGEAYPPCLRQKGQGGGGAEALLALFARGVGVGRSRLRGLEAGGPAFARCVEVDTSDSALIEASSIRGVRAEDVVGWVVKEADLGTPRQRPLGR